MRFAALFGELDLLLAFGETGALKIGISAMYGTYDPDAELDVLLLGADMALRWGDWSLRTEYLLRRTKMAISSNPAEQFHYGPGADGRYDPYFLKEGWYIESEYRVAEDWIVVGRFDGMRRRGNVPVGSKLRKDSLVLRYTAGLAWRIHTNVRLKLSGEVYDFTDFEDDVALHLGLVGAF